MDTILQGMLGMFVIIQSIGLWCFVHPAASTFFAGLAAELWAKYSPWHGADGIIETVWKAILKTEPGGKLK